MATIALAIGANAAMFSFVHGILLTPLPYPQSDRIVRVLERNPTGGVNGISTLNYLDWTAQNDVFEFIAAEAGWRATLTGGDEPALIRGARVSAGYFDIFGVKAEHGRTFLPHEDERGKDHVVLLSHALWESRFGADAGLLGRDLVLNGQPYTLVGILPKGGPFDRAAAQIWTPLAFDASTLTRDFRWLGASARLKPRVTLENARAEMDLIGRRLAAAHPESNAGWGVSVDRLADVVIGPQLRTAVAVLFAATLLVLLIGCANLANLALARSLSRQGEMAVRAALGASRWRLVRLVLTEHLVLTACGGLAGVGIGYAILRWIEWLIPPFTLPPAVSIRMDVPVLLVTGIMVAVTGLLFAAAPAVRIASLRAIGVVHGDGQGTTVVGPRRITGALVVAEIALAFVLLVASGLLMRSLFKLLAIDPGFDAANVLTAELPISQEQHPDLVELNAYVASLRAAIEGVPGVRETAVTSALPLQGWGYGVPYAIAGRGEGDVVNRRTAFFKIVSPSYVHALGIRLLAGRGLSESDRADAPPVALINDAMARREFPGANPIGQHILARTPAAGTTALGPEIAWEVVGVIAAEKITGIGDDASAGMYVSNQQSPTYNLNLIVRAGIAPAALQGAVRSAIARVSRDQALSDVRTLEHIVDQSMLGNRVESALLAGFSSVALLLAALGIYGVISYNAARRTHEMGIRAALGATAGRLRGLILRDGLRLAVPGLLLGLFLTFPAADVLSSMLYGVGTYDVLTIGAVAAVLGATAVVACVLPARRITKTDPIEALRYE